MGALKSAMGVAAIAALVMLVRPVHPGATWSPSWMKLTAFSHGAAGLFWFCGATGDGLSVFGEPWRPCFERPFDLIRTTPGSYGGVKSTDIEFPAPAMGRGSPARKVGVRVYRPISPKRHGPLPVLLWIHGGGWTVSHVSDPDYDETCRSLAREGDWVVVTPEYRLAPENPFPAAVHDNYAALQWASASGPDHPALTGTDRTLLVIGGDSAGGNLAAVLAAMSRAGVDPTGEVAASVVGVKHQLLVYPTVFPAVVTVSASSAGFRDTAMLIDGPVIDFMFGSYLHKVAHDPGFNASLDPRTSPVAAAKAGGGLGKLPPVTMVLAQFDPLVDEGRHFAALLEGAGVPVELHEYAMPHGFFCLPMLKLPETADAVERVVAHVNRGLRGHP